ncbi:hypothetical protein [Klebsiella pneumoniae]|uniref:hypothetical protein n=1 Tax=Klebsiella pneumoniae TaxID=573 RepID=UPI0012619642|nr:hypothetical protein [Klebsiella pneumoniae]KAB7536413.1 hypothetical protein GBV82_06510 [Klebsiella pneumoniae]
MLNSAASRPATLMLCSLALLMAGCTPSPGKPEIRDITSLANENAFNDIQHLTASRCRELIRQHSTMQSLPFGCANQLNLEAMVERPEDLRRARPMGYALAQPVAQGVLNYLSAGQEKDEKR